MNASLYDSRHYPGIFGGRSRIDDCPCCGSDPNWRQYPRVEVFCANVDCGLMLTAETIQEAAARWNRREGEERAFGRGCIEGTTL